MADILTNFSQNNAPRNPASATPLSRVDHGGRQIGETRVSRRSTCSFDGEDTAARFAAVAPKRDRGVCENGVATNKISPPTVIL